MSAADFFDSNVLLYLFDDSDARKQSIAESLVNEALAAASGCISFQVVQETLSALTCKFARRVDTAMAEEILKDVLTPLWQVQPSAALYAQGLQLQNRYKLSFYDSLVVAAANEAGCSRLFSEDLPHQQKIGGVMIENPFRV